LHHLPDCKANDTGVFVEVEKCMINCSLQNLLLDGFPKRANAGISMDLSSLDPVFARLSTYSFGSRKFDLLDAVASY
jgi:hypothetical protein